jgi:alpha-glucosidase (family GH31 glycosyl hydrolase)
VITVTPGLDKIPVYVKDGGIIPMMPANAACAESREKLILRSVLWRKAGKYINCMMMMEKLSIMKKVITAGEKSKWRKKNADGKLKGTFRTHERETQHIGNVTWKFMT